MNRIAALFATLFIALSALAAAGPSRASACTAADFGAVVDETAQALRDLNASGAERFQAKLKSFQQKHGLSDAEIQTRAASIQDGKMSEFNREIETLVSQMDGLSQTPNENINCETLGELKRVRDRLLTVMGQKSGYLLAKADLELDRPAGAPATQQTEVEAPKSEEASAGGTADKPGKEDRLALTAEPSGGAGYLPPSSRDKVETAPETAAPAPKAEAPAPGLNPELPERRPNNARIAENWQTDSQTIAPDPGQERPRQFAARTEPSEAPPTSLSPDAGDQPLSPPPGAALPPPDAGLDTTYSIEEISDAGRGLFGTVTAQFAAAVNYAFQQFGQPNAYITGSEGGAAFLAGLRYGKGMLHSKTHPKTAIYWQGPSLGYDLGAEGSDALFLVYNLEDRDRIYGRFTGVGGSAYVAGGVGLNVLAKGGMVMVPIRTGIGLRIGANLAYLKFTERQTWNPF